MSKEERTEEQIIEDQAAIYIEQGYEDEEAYELAEMDFNAGSLS